MQQPANVARSTHFAFTVHHHTAIPTQIDFAEIPDIQYLVFQEELPQSLALHVQGYIQYSARKRYQQVVDHLTQLFEPAEGQAHVESARGSDAENEAYCTKAETRADPEQEPTRFGERVPHAGKKGGRTDLLAVKQKIDSGASLKTVAREHFSEFCRHERAFRSYKRLITEPRNGRPEIFVHIGPSGCGKTSHCREAYPGAYWHPGGKWWDDYDGETTVVFDEFYGHKMSFSQLLAVLDWYELRVETKGGSAQLLATTFVFTSNQDPQDWYDKEKTHQPEWEHNPLKRRLDEFGFIVYWNGWRRPVPEPLVIMPPAAACPHCANGLCAFHHI